MPIGDLLAQISGGKGDAPPARPRPDTQIKRKASEDLRSEGPPKTPRFAQQPSSKPATVAKPPVRPSPAQAQRPSHNGTALKMSSSSASSKPISKPSSPAPAAARAAPPKKGSFAEILARGKLAQTTMGQVGKIQHKKVEGKGRQPRDEAPPSPQRVSRKGGAASTGYSGTGKASSRGGGGSSSSKGGRMASSRSGPPSKKGAPPEPEKKIKKAALATTGYAGTARPRPGNPAKKTHGPRGGALLNGPVHHHGSKSKYDDYDEELDDFIEYDDEEDDDGRGPRYDYASDNSSDMEAGLEDIDDEERSAERIARMEDIEEQRREARLKAEKEERRRRWMAGR